MKIALISLLTLLAACTPAAQKSETKPEPAPKIDISAQVRKSFIESYGKWEASVKTDRPDFRLIRAVTSLPGRSNATVKLPVTTIPEGVVATLHDDTTGAPLESCLTPCSLRGVPSEQYGLVLFKEGHHAQAITPPPELWPSGLGDTSIGPNYFEILDKVESCKDNFERQGIEQREAKPCTRVPPQMPTAASKSGHCNVMFDIEPSGYLRNIRIVRCSDDIFKQASEYALTWWFYDPQVSDSKPIWTRNERAKLTFRLTNEQGGIIPMYSE